ncbi:hypothetical protein, partial [Streptomyces mirabilis]|uniref:hypothetical protein n=1 Tax=Streptomyces mirabilis TaxID=68239 RepID=UPI0036B8B808
MCRPGFCAASCATAVAAVSSCGVADSFGLVSEEPPPPPPEPLAACVSGAEGTTGAWALGEGGAAEVEGLGGSVLMPASWSFSVAAVRTWGLYVI